MVPWSVGGKACLSQVLGSKKLAFSGRWVALLALSERVCLEDPEAVLRTEVF